MEERSIKDLRLILLEMYKHAWEKYLRARNRNPELKPTAFFFGDQDRAEKIAYELERRFANRVTRALSSVVL